MWTHGNHAAEDATMVIATIIGLLVLFSLISFLLGTDNGGQQVPDRDREAMFWMRFGNH